MKIALIGPTYPYRGGISHYNTVFCENLSKKHDIKVISFKCLYPKFLFPGKDQRDLNSEKKIGIKAKEIINSVNPFTWLQAFLEIKKFNPKFMIMYWWTPYFVFVFSTIALLTRTLTQTKIIFLCHNVIPHEKRFIDKLLTRFTLRNSDYFIVHASEEKKELLDMFPKAKVIQHVHPTYDIFKNKFQKKDLSSLKLRKNTILFFGFVREYKGLIYLLKAMPKIIKEIDLDLLIVGEFWKDKKKYLSEIRKLRIQDYVKIIDSYVPNEEVGNYFKISDLIVLPYLTATNSGIVQISYGFEKPVVVTNVGGLPEVVSENKTGLIVKPKDQNALAKSIIQFYKNNLKEKFLPHILKEKARFSWDKLVEVVENFDK